MLINAFPSGGASNKRVELCRFTTSGTFNPAEYPTADGLYDVYIVGGGGGSYGSSAWMDRSSYCGGGGGYAKLLKNLDVTNPTAVVIGAAGTHGGYSEWENGSSHIVSPTNGSATTFGTHSVNGGSCAGYDSGGNGGCGGAGLNGIMGGIDGHNGSAGRISAGSSTNDRTLGIAGQGGGDTDYCPHNPYDDKSYGVGGNSMCALRDGTTYEYSSTLATLPTNYNAGRGGGYNAEALPGICIVYGIPKY